MSNPVAEKPKPPRINLRTPEVMSHVQAQVERHYQSSLVEQLRSNSGVLETPSTRVHLAKEFGFCYGVERAIDLAYAARKVFPDDRMFIVGEIIHNPDVNEHITNLGIQNLSRPSKSGIALKNLDLSVLQKDDVVILPAFGAETKIIDQIKALGCRIVDTTCGDVMSVWKRVRQNAKEQVTSIIHGKAAHEETRATASRALGKDGGGHYLVVLDITQTKLVRQYMCHGGDREAFLEKFKNATSEGFDPDLHLQRIGVANQTTMLRSETEAIQNELRDAILERDNGDPRNFRYFDTICGATQDRQDALFGLLHNHLDLLLVVGGYNSSNTTHLVEIGEKKVPTFFIRDASRLHSETQIAHFDIHQHEEITTTNWLPKKEHLVAGVTAGASCPNNLIEEVIQRLLELRHETAPTPATA
ncbi:MAG: 4-hydroxy-3-methylbut-2-enyl diphosphate reductase [Chthoniobacterales bacterium]